MRIGIKAALAGAALVLSAAAGLAPAPAAAQAPRGTIDLSTAEGAIAAQRRIWCTERDGEAVYWTWAGEVYSRRAGEPDKLLFGIQGYNVRTCGKATDAQRGEGFRTVSRELLIYLDPQTRQPLARWANPWTGETVDVLHVANDPVNGAFYLKGRDGKPATWSGRQIESDWFLTSTIPLFYSNPLGGEFQPEVGGTYHATEMFNFMGDLASLTDRRRNTADVMVGWVRISDWLPWMKMGDREGALYFHSSGKKALKYEDVPQVVRDEIARHYPEYRNPPPVDDARPNETSWTYYKKVRAGQITPPKRN